MAAAAAIVGILCAITPAPCEPHGHAVLEVEWLKPAGQGHLGPDERALRVVIRSAVPIRDAALGFRGPTGVTLAPRPAGGAPAPPPAPTGPDGTPRLSLGTLQPDRSTVLEFVVHAPPGAAGTAVFTLEGETLPGRSIVEKLGWTVGTPAAPTRRHGAAEYPARVVPEDPR